MLWAFPAGAVISLAVLGAIASPRVTALTAVGLAAGATIAAAVFARSWQAVGAGFLVAAVIAAGLWGRVLAKDDDALGVNLRGADLTKRMLAGRDLRSGHLEGVRAVRSVLAGARLSGARLNGADLRGADLRGAYLDKACLRGADLTDAHLEGADFTGADRQGAAAVSLPDGVIGWTSPASIDACR